MNSLEILGHISYYIKEFNHLQHVADLTSNNNILLSYIIEITKLEIITKIPNIDNTTLFFNLDYLIKIREEIHYTNMHIDDIQILDNIICDKYKLIFEKIIYNNNNGLHI